MALHTVFSTSDVRPRDRFDYWHDVACETIVEHTATADVRLSFSAELSVGNLAGINLVLFENSPMRVCHTARQATRADGDSLFFCRQLAGNVALEQHDREVLLESGDMVLVDPRAPYAARFSANSKLLLIKASREAIRARVGEVQDLAARGMRPSAAETAMTSALIGQLPTYASELGATAASMVEDHVLDLLSLSLANAAEGRTLGMSSSRILTRARLKATINARLADPELNAATVASAVGVSLRYANQLLASEGMSIMRLVRDRRLDRCRQALEDPAQMHRTISEIAYGWGFSDMTHFGRSFRSKYGLLPGELRRTARAPH